MKLSVIYSFYNEEENLPELIRRTRLAMRNIGLDNRGYEIVFVNDVSKDRSVEIITEHMEQGKDIKLVNTTRTFGNAACILAGFAFSTGEHIAFLDADLQDPPELIERVYKVARDEGYDIVHTKRTKRHGEHPIKLLITKLGYAILGSSMSVPLESNVGDFKLISRRVADAVLKLNEPLPFMRGMISYVGFKSKTLEYEREARFAGETHFPVYGWRVISNFLNNALISYSDLPIYAILVASGLGMLFALLLAVYAIYVKVIGLDVPGTTGILLVVAGFSSIILFGMGILGLYLASIKRAVMRRPTYLIESTRGYDQPQR